MRTSPNKADSVVEESSLVVEYSERYAVKKRFVLIHDLLQVFICNVII
jgi:hypothetical protein